MNIENMPVLEVKPYENNPRRNDKAVKRVAQSIKDFGFQQPIVVDSDNVIVVGHTRWRAAQELGLTHVPVVKALATKEQLQAYRIADNKLNELATWDDDLLFKELEEIVARGDENKTGFSAEEINDIFNQAQDTAYTTKIDTPVYTPKGDRPGLNELYTEERTKELVKEIEASSIPADIKSFLIRAADRHRQFDYQQIAEYYAHAEPEVQRLMEASALVIIDFNQAIERGYVNLTKDLKQNYQADYEADI